MRDTPAAGHEDHADGREMRDLLRGVASPAGEIKRGIAGRTNGDANIALNGRLDSLPGRW